VRTRQIHLKYRPEGLPVIEDFALVINDLSDLATGQVLVRNRYMSVDPCMRGRMRDNASYAAPFEIGGVLKGYSVGEIVASADPDYEEGNAVTGIDAWREYFIAPGKDLARVDPTRVPL